MGKQKCRQACRAALMEAGFTEPQLYFERNSKNYSSYWGSGLRRAEVLLNKRNKVAQIFELRFTA